METSDLVAVRKARAGDADAFRLLVERHSRYLFRLLYRMTGNIHDAEDLVQDTLLKAYRHLDRFDGRAGFRTWLCRIGANNAIDLLRSRQSPAPLPELEPSASTPSPERLAASGQAASLLEHALQRLTAMERSAFVLRHAEGATTGQISTALGVDPNAAKHAVFRAVRKLRQALAPVAGRIG
jgi:RNA polymerase sigma-70 factor (ECF subfamily)